MKGANIENIVLQFKKMNDTERYQTLCMLMEGDAVDEAEFTWRAHLCTALSKAQVYPVTSGTDEEPIR